MGTRLHLQVEGSIQQSVAAAAVKTQEVADSAQAVAGQRATVQAGQATLAAKIAAADKELAVRQQNVSRMFRCCVIVQRGGVGGGGGQTMGLTN